MTILVLPPRSDVTSYLGTPMDIDRANLVVGRIRDAMIEAGMALGPAGVFVSPEGISVDTELSQESINAAWATFDIANYRSPAERKKKDAEAAALAAITTLRSDAANLETLTTITLRQTQQGLARTNRIVALLLEYLIDNGVIPRSS